MSRPLALALAVSAAVAAAAALPLQEPSAAVAALAGDDQCAAAGRGCTVNALQARARKVASAALAAGGTTSAAPTAAEISNGSDRADVGLQSCKRYGCSAFVKSRPCQCDSRCSENQNCCPDYAVSCSGSQNYTPADRAACYAAANVYLLSWKAEGASFFDEWTFVTEDMVHGAQQFTNRSEAKATGVISAGESGAYLGVGGLREPSRPDEAYKRYAPHIRTNLAWDPSRSFVIAMKYTHVPFGCGVWPGFWTVNSDVVWPEGGELDIMEYANYDESKVSFHAASHCTLDTRRVEQCLPNGTSSPGPSDCYTSYFENAFGCIPRQHQRRSSEYAQTPGVIAAEWTPDHIAVFLFPEGQIPADLQTDRPNPAGWSEFAVAFLPFEKPCSIIRPQELVLNIQLCGDAAGGPWDKGACGLTTLAQRLSGGCVPGLSQPTDCCTQFVTSAAQEVVLRQNAYFKVEYVKVFTPGGIAGSPSGTYRRNGTLLH